MRAQVAAAPEYRPSAYWEEELADVRVHAGRVAARRREAAASHALDHRPARVRLPVAEGPREGEVRREAEGVARGSARPICSCRSGAELGGFGFEIDGRLFNIDTLKFFEVLIALEKGAVLQEFRGNAERRLVWEIGAGWGGFPYQFKSLCPNVTYVISDFPELFLFSATYLMTAFPDARVAFWGEEPADRLFDAGGISTSSSCRTPRSAS